MTQAENIAAALLLLKKMGIEPNDLLQEPAPAPQIPTFAEYIPRVAQAVSPGTRRVYATYWNRVIDAWGPRIITEPSPLEISQLAEHIKASITPRRNARGGHSAAEHLIGALRCMYSHAVADGLLPQAANPAARVPKPRRLPTSRMALPDTRLAEITAIAATTGNDPALDALLIRLHTETACRRGGALALTPGDLDPEHCLTRLREKGGTERWQPVSPTLMTHLLAHAESRGGLNSGERLLRYATGRSITARRYDYLWTRLGEHLPWVKTQQVTTHWIRHTILTWVERRFGFAVAQAYAGHHDTTRGARAMSATGTYVRAGLPEVATALAILTGEPHPLAPKGTVAAAEGCGKARRLGLADGAGEPSDEQHGECPCQDSQHPPGCGQRHGGGAGRVGGQVAVAPGNADAGWQVQVQAHGGLLNQGAGPSRG